MSRIELSHLTESDSRFYWWFTIKEPNSRMSIPGDILVTIKDSIERILNNEPTPPGEERNEAIEFAEWIMTNHYVHDVDDLAGYYWFQEDIQSQPMLNTKQLYELFKTRKQ